MTVPLPALYKVVPFTSPANAHVHVPGSKSITNRALALGALCGEGVKLFYGLQSRDTRIMQQALTALGRDVSVEADSVSVNGNGGVFFPNHRQVDLHVGNAGTVARFLTAMLCLQEDGEFHIDGDAAMHRRPLKGLTDALASLGAEFEFHGMPGCIPFTLRTHGIKDCAVEVDASESSQILSALLIMAAGVGRPFEVELTGRTVSRPFVKMTTRMLEQFGVKVSVAAGRLFRICGPVHFDFSNAYVVEPDATAASYFSALPLAVGGTTIIERMGQCRLQGDIRFINVLRSVGMNVETATDMPGHPDVLRSRVEGKSRLRGVKVDFEAFSDTFLTLAALTPLLEGRTRIEGIAHTRRQETDRVAAMAAELRKLGQCVTEEEGALEIVPELAALKRIAAEAREKSPSGCVEMDTYHDHRFAMSFAILGCRDLLEDGRPWLAIRDPACCGKTFPDFFEVLESVREQSHR